MDNFERTLDLISIRVNGMLNSSCRRIWVQGCNKPKVTRLVFTIFTNDGYTMRFLDVKNFRQFHQNADDMEKEMDILERNVKSLEISLGDYINF